MEMANLMIYFNHVVERHGYEHFKYVVQKYYLAFLTASLIMFLEG